MARLTLVLSMLLFMLAAGDAAAQAPDQRGVLNLERRVALVIGNSDYRHIPDLLNPRNDARAMARQLRESGFSLVGDGPLLDLDKAGMEDAILRFGQMLLAGRSAPEGVVGLFYFAGHGVQSRNRNYLLPVSIDLQNEAGLSLQAINASLVLEQFEAAGARLAMMVLDACRNNPFPGSEFRNVQSGLSQMQAAAGTLIGFAAQPGGLAADAPGEPNSPYTAALLEKMRMPGLNVLDVFNEVGLAVSQRTNNMQQPWVSSSPIPGRFYFTRPAVAPPPATAPAPPAAGLTPPSSGAVDLAFWQSIQNSPNAAEFEAYLAQFPSGTFAALARARLAALRAQQQAAVTPTLPPVPATAPSPPVQAALPPALPPARAPIHECDRLAAAPLSVPGLRGVEFARIDVVAARSACEAARREYPQELRFVAFLGRVEFAGRQDTEALGLLRPAAAQGNAVAQNVLAVMYLAGRGGLARDEVEAVRLLRLAADQGNAQAQVGLGAMHENGRGGLARDEVEAVRLYRLAADQGHAQAQVNLGIMYAQGRGGLARDESEAVRLYRLAAGQGHAAAQTNLGHRYFHGGGVLPQDDREALRWFRLAAGQGHSQAQYSLGYMHANGRGGLTRDEREAVRLYRLAADQGSADAQYALAVRHMDGRGGLARDDREAVRLFRLAADQGHAGAQTNLGFMHETGRGGLLRDEREAVRLYRLAADQGEAGAQNNLGGMYEAGRGGLMRNRAEAIRLYRLAAAQGDQNARRNLARLTAPRTPPNETEAPSPKQ